MIHPREELPVPRYGSARGNDTATRKSAYLSRKAQKSTVEWERGKIGR